MQIHAGKTKCMILTTRQKHQINPIQLDLTLKTNKIEQVNSHKVLGLIIDSTFSWQEHTLLQTK